MAIITYPHGPLVALGSNAWVVSAKTSQGIDRKMTVARAPDGALLLHDALWLDERTFAEFDALGKVRTILVPSWLHDFDGQRFAARYPEATLCSTPTACKRLRWPRLVEWKPELAIPGVYVTPLPGLRMDEFVCEIRHPEGGVTLVFTDALFNMSHGKGLRGWVFRVAGSTGPLHMTPIGRMFLLKDRRVFKRYLEEQAARDDVKNIVVGHGRLIQEGARAALAGAAARL